MKRIKENSLFDLDYHLNLTSIAHSWFAIILRDNTQRSGLSPKNLEGLNADNSIYIMSNENNNDDDLINQSGN